MALVDSLMQQLESRGAVEQIAAKLGVPPEKATSAVSAAVPAILAGLAGNTTKPEGAAALSAALDKDHDGSVLQDDTYFDSYQEKKGGNILGHVFGDKTSAVESQVSALGGLDVLQGGEVMKMLAPLVMGYLGKEKSGGGLDIGNLSQILGGGGGGNGGGGLQLPGGLGEILGGLAGGAQASSGGSAKSSGLGGMLGKFLKKKK